jgi:hypothetical protein
MGVVVDLERRDRSDLQDVREAATHVAAMVEMHTRGIPDRERIEAVLRSAHRTGLLTRNVVA